jgi:hypothetical protein
VGVPQLSVAVGAVQLTNVHESMLTKLMFVGQRDKVGLIKSVGQGFVFLLTVTVKAQVAVLLRESFPVYVTVVTPTGKQAPEMCEAVKVGVPQLSVMRGADQRATAQVSDVKTILLGHLVMTGFVVSPAQGVLVLMSAVTVTLNEHVAVLFFASFPV